MALCGCVSVMVRISYFKPLMDNKVKSSRKAQRRGGNGIGKCMDQIQTLLEQLMSTEISLLHIQHRIVFYLFIKLCKGI